MIRHKKHRRHRQRESRDHGDMIAICLSDGPRTVSEIEKQFIAFPRRFGLFVELVDQEAIDRGDLARDLLIDLEKMRQAGWLELQGERYALTPLGHGKAAERLAGLRTVGGLARKLVQPQMVSKVSLGVHLGLAALKLPAGLLSGSVGLINDAADTLLDGLASLLVYAGFRLNRERAVSVVLVLLMLGTGGLTFYEAVRRFFAPFEPEVSWLAFLAAVLSALVCLALWGYQRYVGLRSGSVALITQSVDSRNHVIVALGVTTGLVASLLHFSLLDTLVGLAVAILLLKSAVELGIETIRSLRKGDVDISRYSMGLVERYAQFRQAQLRDWMLYLVEKEKISTQADLRARAGQAFDFSDNPALRGLGLDRQGEASELVEHSLQELYKRGWLVGDERLRATDAGKERLSRLMGRTHGRRHRRSAAGQRAERSRPAAAEVAVEEHGAREDDMTHGHKHRKAYQHRTDLTGEHAVGDIGQLVLACLFAAMWVADSFFLKYTTFLNDHVPLAIRIPLAVVLLGISAYLAWTGMSMVFGETRDEPGVIRTGVFGIVRHPIYFSEVLVYLGFLMLSLSLAAAVVWCIAVVFLHYISRWEEKLLLARFGEEYAQYMRDVPMWIPRLRRR